MKRPFATVATTYEEQVALLQQCGVIVDDAAQARFYLQHINCYRLGTFWLAFEADWSMTARRKPNKSPAARRACTCCLQGMHAIAARESRQFTLPVYTQMFWQKSSRKFLDASSYRR